MLCEAGEMIPPSWEAETTEVVVVTTVQHRLTMVRAAGAAVVVAQDNFWHRTRWC